MDWKLTHETLCRNETVWEGTAEQGYALDYLLPDYCSGIFKLLKCFALPVVTGKVVVGDKLTLDGTVQLRLLYIGEEDHRIAAVTQSVPFTKTVDLPRSCNNAAVSVNASGGSVSCRVVNAKRVDIHGSVLMPISVTEQQTFTALTDVQGQGVQTRSTALKIDGSCKHAEKQFTLQEEWEAAAYDGAAVLDLRGSAVITEHKLLAGKAIIKGEAQVHILLSMPDGSLTAWQQSLPFSQIIDVNGLSEEDQPLFSVELLGIEAEQSGSGEDAIIGIAMQLRVTCTAYESREVALLTDAYSVCYPCELQRMPVNLTRLDRVLSERETAHLGLSLDSVTAVSVADVLCDIAGVQTSVTPQGVSLAIAVRALVIGIDDNGLPFAVEQTVTHQMELPCELTDAHRCRPEVTLTASSFSVSDQRVDLRLSIAVTGSITYHYQIEAIDALRVDEENRLPENDAGLVLYFAKEGESVWEIAKAYRSEVSGITAENALEGDTLDADRVLLIPASGSSHTAW